MSVLTRLNIAGIDVGIKRSRRRSLQLEVGHAGVIARAPLRMSEPDIVAFVEQKKPWLERQLQNRPTAYQAFDIKPGAQLPFLDNTLELYFDSSLSGAAQFDDETVRLSVPMKRCHREPQAFAARKIEQWYRSQALKLFNQLNQQIAPQMGLSINTDIKVRDYKRRWGSCDAKGNLSFNWRLIMAPQLVLEYVLVHELAHRYEFNHSRRFWNIVEQYQPDWRRHRDWLYQHGLSLYRL